VVTSTILTIWRMMLLLDRTSLNEFRKIFAGAIDKCSTFSNYLFVATKKVLTNGHPEKIS